MYRSKNSQPYALAFPALALAALLSCQGSSSNASGLIAADANAAPAPVSVPAPPSSAAQPPAPSGERQLGAMPSLAPLVKTLRPVVVNIDSRFKPQRPQRMVRNSHRLGPQPQQPGPNDGDDNNGEGEDPMERFFRYFGNPHQQPDGGERHGLGSGFIIGEGLILTNNHVVEVQDEPNGKFRAMDEIKIRTDETSPGGVREFTAHVIGNDPKSDIAVLKIEGAHVNELKQATLGDSDALEVGDYVVAIGEPFGLQATVTSGIISAKERSQFGGPYSDYLQTDASINPGNSGGPLFNMRGEVVGVNSAIISGANTIGFAIPIAVVKQILPQLQSKGKVSRGFLGVAPQAITQDMVEQLGLKSTQGALVADVVKESPAEAGGLKPGDVIVALNGKKVADNNQLTRDIGAVPPGGNVKLDVIRDGKPRTFDVKIAPRPDETDEVAKPMIDRSLEQSGKVDSLGMQVEDPAQQQQQQQQGRSRGGRADTGETRGALVADVAPDSPASSAGIEPGDVIMEVNRQPVTNAADYHRATKGLKKGDTALLRVHTTQGGTRYLPVHVG